MNMDDVRRMAAEAVELDTKGMYTKAKDKYFALVEVMMTMLKSGSIPPAEEKDFQARLISFMDRIEALKKMPQTKPINTLGGNTIGGVELPNIQDPSLWQAQPTPLQPTINPYQNQYQQPQAPPPQQQFNPYQQPINQNIPPTITAPSPQPPSSLTSSGSANVQKDALMVANTGDKEEDSRQNQILACIIKDVSTRLSDVAGLNNAKMTLKSTIMLPFFHPELFKQKNIMPWKGILMYGPPGTGKSYLAQACAGEMQSNFFRISASDIVNKYVGESAKMITSLFRVARSHSPAIVFVDEIDSLLSNREESGQSSAMKQVVNEFLVQMDGVGTKNSNDVLVLGATNMPWSLDDAILRRFQKRVYIPLPDEEARTELFKIELKKVPDNILTEKNIVQLSKRTEGFSGSDISNLINDAKMLPLKDAQSSEYFNPIQVGGSMKYTPCTRDTIGAVKLTIYDIPQGCIYLKPMCIEDFNNSLEKIKKTVSEAVLAKFDKWTKEYGEAGK